MNTKFSIVMPTHNRGALIQASLQSVLRQTCRDFEFIIVDDASQPPAIETFPGITTDPRVKYVYLEKNVGPSAARNVGIENASGEYIAFLDDDDEFHPEKLAAVKDVIDGGHPDVIYHKMTIHLVREGFRYVNAPYEGVVTLHKILVRNLCGCPSMVVVSREALKRVGGFNVALPALEDYELWIRLAKAGCRFSYLGEALTDYQRDTRRGSRTTGLTREEKARGMLYELYREDFAQFSPEMWKDHRQKLAMYRGYRALVGYNRFQACTFFLRAFWAWPSWSLSGLGLLTAAGLSVASPKWALLLQGRLKHARTFRKLYGLRSAAARSSRPISDSRRAAANPGTTEK